MFQCVFVYFIIQLQFPIYTPLSLLFHRVFYLSRCSLLSSVKTTGNLPESRFFILSKWTNEFDILFCLIWSWCCWVQLFSRVLLNKFCHSIQTGGEWKHEKNFTTIERVCLIEDCASERLTISRSSTEWSTPIIVIEPVQCCQSFQHARLSRIWVLNFVWRESKTFSPLKLNQFSFLFGIVESANSIDCAFRIENTLKRTPYKYNRPVNRPIPIS